MNPIFTEKLERWYAENKRELPWRDTHDAYRIWVSEIILQQTRVAQGYDYFLRFVKRFPNVESLAVASEDDVLLLWQGLGYYSRARNLHKAAQQVVQMGGFPTDYDRIRSLAGIGDYTAAAIASFAFGLPYAVLDGNVYRVLSRYLGIDTPIDTTQGKHLFASLAQEMLDERQPALSNQAIMDFGAVQCTPASPDCLHCPLAETCEALCTQRVDQLPMKSKRTKVRTRHLVYTYVRAGKNILLHRRCAGDIWTGLYEPPLVEVKLGAGVKEDNGAAFKELEEQLRQEVAKGIVLKTLSKDVKNVNFVPIATGMKHQLTHQTLLASCYLLSLKPCELQPVTVLERLGFQVIPESERDNFAVPRLVLEMYKKLSEYDQKHPSQKNSKQ